MQGIFHKRTRYIYPGLPGTAATRITRVGAVNRNSLSHPRTSTWREHVLQSGRWPSSICQKSTGCGGAGTLPPNIIFPSVSFVESYCEKKERNREREREREARDDEIRRNVTGDTGVKASFSLREKEL